MPRQFVAILAQTFKFQSPQVLFYPVALTTFHTMAEGNGVVIDHVASLTMSPLVLKVPVLPKKRQDTMEGADKKNERDALVNITNVCHHYPDLRRDIADFARCAVDRKMLKVEHGAEMKTKESK